MIRDFQIALFRLRDYGKLLRRSLGRFIAFCLMLSMFTWLAIYVIPVGSAWIRVGGVRHFLDEHIPDFTLENGKLSMPKGLHLEGADYYIDINTSPENKINLEAQETRTLMALKTIVLLGDADQLIMQSEGTGIGSRYQQIRFNEISGYLNKDVLLSLTRYLYVPMVLVGIFLFFVTLIGFFFFNMVEALLGLIIARVMRVPLRYGESYRLAAYARATSTILVGLINLAGFDTELLLYPALVLDLFIFYRALQAGLVRDEEAESAQSARELSIRTAPRDAAETASDGLTNAEAQDTDTEPARRAEVSAEKREDAADNMPDAAENSEPHTSESGEPEPQDAALPDGGAEEADKSTREDITPSDGWSF